MAASLATIELLEEGAGGEGAGGGGAAGEGAGGGGEGAGGGGAGGAGGGGGAGGALVSMQQAGRLLCSGLESAAAKRGLSVTVSGASDGFDQPLRLSICLARISSRDILHAIPRRDPRNGIPSSRDGIP